MSQVKTTGRGMVEFMNVLGNLNPTDVITSAVRYETMAITLSVSYLNISVLWPRFSDRLN